MDAEELLGRMESFYEGSVKASDERISEGILEVAASHSDVLFGMRMMIATAREALGLPLEGWTH
jgi:hypothetical protein